MENNSMDDIILKDDMKKERKIYLIPMILFVVLVALFPIAAILHDFSDKELIIVELAFALFTGYFFYGFLYTLKYNVTITKDRIQLKTLFRTIILNVSDIKEYNYKRYMKSAFYQFKIFYLDKKIKINTRYHEALDKMLKEELSNR